jgi:hypothetical protein
MASGSSRDFDIPFGLLHTTNAYVANGRDGNHVPTRAARFDFLLPTFHQKNTAMTEPSSA